MQSRALRGELGLGSAVPHHVGSSLQAPPARPLGAHDRPHLRGLQARPRDRAGDLQRLGAIHHERARDPVAVAERLLAIQAQDLRGALLAVRARSTGLTRTDVEDACTRDRSLVVTWLNRGTLHLVRAVDYPWLQVLTAPRTRVANARRLQQEGVDGRAATRGVGVIVDALGREGTLTRGQLRDRLDAVGVRTAGQALVHLLVRASLEGHVVRGPFVGGTQAFVLTSDWLGDAEAVKVCHDIARAIEEQLNYPGEIKVTVVRETRAVEFAR